MSAVSVLLPESADEAVSVPFDEDLFFGRVPVFFKRVEGEVHSSASFALSSAEMSEADIDVEAVLRGFPQTTLGVDYSHLLLPAMPCADIKQSAISEEASGKRVPFGSALLKCRKDESESLAALGVAKCAQSGIRSALVLLVSGKWLRLKGCGNEADGFKFACVGDGRLPLVEMRGVCFKHTTLRELHLNECVAAALKDSELHEFCVCANLSVGYFHYTASPLPKALPSCGVFETVGNRRLGSHLLYALDALIPVLFSGELDSAQISDAFEARICDGEIVDTHLAVACEMPVASRKALAKVRVPLVSKWPATAPLIAIEGDAMQHEFDSAIRRLLAALRSANGEPFAGFQSALLHLCFRLGFECGFVQRVLRRARMLWGTYRDALGTHCNAHCNNYALCAQWPTAARFITAPLDFDMAFGEAEYFGKAPEAVAKLRGAAVDSAKAMGREWPTHLRSLSVQPFDTLRTLECNANRLSLAGDSQLTSGVRGTAVRQRCAEHRTVATLLRDALVAGFDDALAMDSAALKPFWKTLTAVSDEQTAVLRRIVELCLVLTQNVTA